MNKYTFFRAESSSVSINNIKFKIFQKMISECSVETFDCQISGGLNNRLG